MEQIRIPFIAGLGTLAVGLVLLSISFLIGTPPEGVARTLTTILSFVALLLTAGGGFVVLCTGAVLLVGMTVEERARR